MGARGVLRLANAEFDAVGIELANEHLLSLDDAPLFKNRQHHQGEGDCKNDAQSVGAQPGAR